mgnify:CR=1 FL=1
MLEYKCNRCLFWGEGILKMKKIVLLCAAGMSTSLLVNKMREVATKEGFECDINAYSVSEAQKHGSEADVILLGPQVRFELSRVKSLAKCPVDSIDMRAYGMMDGAKVLQQAKTLMGL